MRAIVLSLVLLLATAAAALAVPAHVQLCSTEPSGTSTTVVCTFGANITAGDAVACVVTFDNSSVSLSSIKDGNLNALTVETPLSDATNTQGTSSAVIVNDPGGTTTVTATFSATASSEGIACDEYSGVATASAIDGATGQVQQTPGTGSNAVTSGNITTTANGDLVWAGVMNDSGAGTFTAGTGYTRRNNNTTFFPLTTEDQAQGSAGSIAGTFTISANNATAAVVIALKAPGGAPPPQRLLLMGIGQ